MPRPLLSLAVFPIAASICCCGCCDLWDWVMDQLNDGRASATQAGEAWLKRDPAARKSFGQVKQAETECCGSFAWTSSKGVDYWEIEYEVDGEKADGVATLQVADHRGRYVVAGALLFGAAGMVETGEHLDRASSEGDGDWDD